VPKEYGQACPVAKALTFLGERWTLLIVRDLLIRPRTFKDLRTSLRGVAPAVLSHRLKVLESKQIVRRGMYSLHPPRAEYSLTERGAELRPVIRALGVWGGRHVHKGSAMLHEACGHPIEMAYFCPDCNRMVESGAVRHLPTPSRRAKRPTAQST
jgi:DNA-binding HxlR family transcriptional regulator